MDTTGVFSLNDGGFRSDDFNVDDVDDIGVFRPDGGMVDDRPGDCGGALLLTSIQEFEEAIS